MKRTRGILGVLVVIALAGASQAALVTIAEHIGDNNPLTGDPTTWVELKDGNWQYVDSHGIASDTPDYPDVACWTINDGGNAAEYGFGMTPSTEQLALLDQGFVLSGRIRVNEPNYSASGAIKLFYRGNEKRWQIAFGSTSDNDPKIAILLEDGNVDTITLTGYGAGYHLYEVKDLDNDGDCDIYVNGNLMVSDWTGYTDSNVGLGWGDFTGAGNDQRGKYNLIRLEAVPEPATMGLLVLGGALGLVRRKR